MDKICATSEGTLRYAKRHSNLSHGFRQLGKSNLTVSQVGFGSYRVRENSLDHREALQLALQSGCNLIDTSTNYTDGESERLIGSVIKNLHRDEIVIVTKVGYVQGENLKLARDRIQLKKPYSEMVEYHNECWHCIHPEFIEDQITRSLERLGLEKVDAVLLHNPEYFLKKFDDHAEYYRRIEAAFIHLEKEVQKGRISYYGISSNTFPDPKDSPEFTSLEVVYELAEKISTQNHFAFVQMPMNLFEPAAALEINCKNQSVIEFAASKNLAVLINRPLNAFHHDKLVRLASFTKTDDEALTALLKKSFERTTLNESKYPGPRDGTLQGMAWGHLLHANFDKIKDLENWKQLLAYQIHPAIEEAVSRLSQNPTTSDWVKEQVQATSELFQNITLYLENLAQEKSHKIEERLNSMNPELRFLKTLSQKTIQTLRSLEGVSAVLVGMRQPYYVKDAIHALTAPPLHSEKALETLKYPFSSII